MFEITITGDISGIVYEKLIDRLIQQSDSFLFHLPNMGKLLVNERNINLFPEYSLGYTEETDQDDHIEYVRNMQPFIDIIRSDVIEHHNDTGYLDQVSSVEIDVFNVIVNEKTKTFFSSTNSILSWRYPRLPEDPCFISNGMCIFQCIAHEGLCYLNYNDPVILALLKENNIDHYRSN